MDYFMFLFICLVTTFVPGPAVFLVIKNATSYGLRKAFAGILGNACAMITMASLSAAGLSVVIMTSEYLFFTVKVIGGSYLIYLGVKAWITSNTASFESHRLMERSKRQLFIEAYVVGATNPKAIAFYTALFPQFIDTSDPVLPQFLVLTLTFALSSFSALLSYAVLSSRFKQALSRRSIMQKLNKVVGSIFILFGFSLFASHRG
ncbi:LysE family translocator [Vibrio viridaestus]|uniref:LysE family translocator n=1 Tax=Vibrio viridaestus TaxID=2487322 RepID=A0A3N9TKE2_9VIBR|nr:LysE family translocator [Vibrio viridaestus]RQW64819.1 LysE family translocator [Vibrio viridaestus]